MNELVSITEVIARKYPDFMGSLNDFASTLEDNETKPQILYTVGEEVGKKVFQNKYKSTKVDGSIEQALKKIVLPAVTPFALAKTMDNELHVTMCPFCVHIRGGVTSAQCHFLGGFVCGLINSQQPFNVAEVTCRAKKDPACIFQINRKY